MTEPICLLVSADEELNSLRLNLENKYKDFAKALGDDCAIFGAVSNLLKDASNVAGQWEKELKGAVKAISDSAAAMFNYLKNLPNGMFAEGLAAIKAAINKVVSAFDTLKDVINDMTDAIKEALNAVKMAMCDTIAAAISAIPPEIAAAAASVAMVKGYNFAKDVNGKAIIGKFDIDTMTTNILRNKGVQSMKDRLLNSANININTSVFDRYSCVVQVEDIIGGGDVVGPL